MQIRTTLTGLCVFVCVCAHILYVCAYECMCISDHVYTQIYKIHVYICVYIAYIERKYNQFVFREVIEGA